MQILRRLLAILLCSAGITSERRLLEEVRMHLAYRWFVRLGLEQVLNDGDGVRRFRSH
jgi:transposase